MATRHINSVILQCDGCDTSLLNEKTFPSAVEARGAAYGEGWRFPPKLTVRTGLPSKNCSDVCPDCLPGWKPQRNGEKPSRYLRQDGTTK